jgi:hypothetical protein
VLQISTLPLYSQRSKEEEQAAAKLGWRFLPVRSESDLKALCRSFERGNQ